MWQLASVGLTVTVAAASSALWVVVILGLMTAIGVRSEVVDAAAVASALLAGCALALSPPVSSFVSGLGILLDRKIRAGDWVSVADREGSVRSVGLRDTVIDTLAGARLIIPNGELAKSTMTLWPVNSPCAARCELEIPVALGADPDRVIEILGHAVGEFRPALAEPAPSITLEGINAGSLMFCLRVFLIDQADAVEIRSRLLISSLRALHSEGIEIPRDQRDIHLRDLDGLKQLARAMLAERRKAPNAQANALDPKGES